ncbi:glycoside hydrolase family 43 protein [Brachybacterium sp. GCM10030267]|uniref:glycoside hydrolase family 43 protein n=1 Tax=unclassified Brachybacterium TaxID=2623841 RepID=UPI0036161D33
MTRLDEESSVPHRSTPLPRRRVLTGALLAAPLAGLATTAAWAEDPSPDPAGSFSPGEPWQDTDGEIIQAHGGQVLVTADAEGPLYYWYGEDRSNGYHDSPGIHVYSSRDLYSWEDEGLALRALDHADQLESDPYFTALYGDYTDDEKAAVIRDLVTVNDPDTEANPAILERPKVLRNEVRGTWVMWVHADGPSETSNAQYAKARAGVAVADSPTGPFRWIDSYRLHVAPEGEENYQPDNPGMARDMNLFLDDDGTAYIIYSSEENYSLFISRLDEEFTYLATGPEDAVKGVDFTRPYIGAHREAPALFKRAGTYYLITSGATGWDPNPAQYATATEILGEWTDHGSPISGEGASDTYGSQSTCVIPVDPERGVYIYMGDRWTPSDLAGSPYVWLPMRFGEGTETSILWEESWSWEDQPAQPVYTVEARMPASVRFGQTERLPRTARLHIDGSAAETRHVSWQAELDRPGQVEVTGTLAGPEGLTLRRLVLVAPHHIAYLVNAGGAETSDYLALRQEASGRPLRNSAADQPFGTDPGTGARWGYEGRSQSSGSATDSMDRSLRYGTDHDDLTYRFGNLDEASYAVHVGYYDPWPWANRAAEVRVNGEVTETQRLFTGTAEAAAYTGIRPDASGAITLTLHPTRSPDIQVSWVAVIRE